MQSARSQVARFTPVAFRGFTQASPARANKRAEVKSDSGERASKDCRTCGRDVAEREGALALLGKNYQVVVACAVCRTSFVALSRN
jgi:hypothetical protein